MKSKIGAAPEEVPMYIVPIGVSRQFYFITFEEIGEYILNQRGVYEFKITEIKVIIDRDYIFAIANCCIVIPSNRVSNDKP
ncbi:MAG: hypothetical protein QXE81_00825 [Desulfurococcaceae archaeon]